jgi:hypothetical protein
MVPPTGKSRITTVLLPGSYSSAVFYHFFVLFLSLQTQFAPSSAGPHALSVPFDLPIGTEPTIQLNSSLRYFVFDMQKYDGIGSQMASLINALCIAQHSHGFTYLRQNKA